MRSFWPLRGTIQGAEMFKALRDSESTAMLYTAPIQDKGTPEQRIEEGTGRKNCPRGGNLKQQRPATPRKHDAEQREGLKKILVGLTSIRLTA